MKTRFKHYFENDFKSYIVQPKMQKVMEETKESMMEYPSIYGKAINEIRQESEEKGIEKGMEITIMNIRRKMGFSVEQIATMTDLNLDYVQSVIDKFEKKI
jgi:predicted transposase/invertase (TIGR01784 family)